MNSTAIAKAKVTRLLKQQEQQNESFENDIMTIVHIIGGIEHILEDYHDRLTIDQIRRVHDYLLTPKESRRNTAMPRTTISAQHQNLAVLEDRRPPYDHVTEQYRFESSETFLHKCFNVNVIKQLHNSLSNIYIHTLIILSIVTFPIILLRISNHYLYVMIVSICLWIPYNLIWILSFNRPAFKHFISNSCEFWIRFLYLFYLYFAGFYYYFIKKYDYEYFIWNKIELILLSICSFLCLFVLTTLDIIEMKQGTKVILASLFPIIPSVVWFIVQFSDFGLNEVSLKIIMANGLNVLSVLLWKQCILTVYFYIKYDEDHAYQCSIIRRNLSIKWAHPQSLTQHRRSLTQHISHKYDGSTAVDEIVNTTAVVHKDITANMDFHKHVQSETSLNLKMKLNEVINKEITVGDTVRGVGQFNKRIGIVRFIGNIVGKKGIFYGIELNDDQYGMNTGSFGGVSYFKTRNNAKCGAFALCNSIHKLKENNDPEMPRVYVGSKVKVKLMYNECIGTIRFIGNIDSNEGVFFGVELDSEHGNNDGSITGRSYFKCEDKHGVFVEAHKFDKYNNINLNLKVTDSGIEQGITPKQDIKHEVMDWLEPHGFGHYFINFVSNGYETLDYISNITGIKDLIDIGITDKDDGDKLMRLIRDKHNENNEYKCDYVKVTDSGIEQGVIVKQEGAKHEVMDWLETNGFEHYLINFVSNGYETLDYISNMTGRQDLIDIGINDKEDQHKLMRLIGDIKSDENNNYNNLNERERKVRDRGIEKEIAPKQEGVKHEVMGWLEPHGFGHYLNNFVSNGYETLDYVSNITEIQDLIDIGIEDKEDQDKLMKLISDKDMMRRRRINK